MLPILPVTSQRLDTLDGLMEAERGRMKCTQRNADDWYPSGYRAYSADYARDLCAGCPVIDACLERTLGLELRARASHGIAGGMPSSARKKVILAYMKEARAKLGPHPDALWNLPQVLAYSKEVGHPIGRTRWNELSIAGRAPRSVNKGFWQAGEVMDWFDKQIMNDDNVTV